MFFFLSGGHLINAIKTKRPSKSLYFDNENKHRFYISILHDFKTKVSFFSPNFKVKTCLVFFLILNELIGFYYFV